MKTKIQNIAPNESKRQETSIVSEETPEDIREKVSLLKREIEKHPRFFERLGSQTS